jgi:hypothetical protein
MADEYQDSEGRRVLRPRVATVNFKYAEKRLFEAAEGLPNWTLADKSRRMLADVNRKLSKELPPRPPDAPLDRLDEAMLCRAAGISAAAITIRAVGSGMALISCGYVVESGQSIRRAQEARLHARMVLDDQGGSYALRFEKAGIALYLLTQASLGMTKTLALLFDVDVEIPPWINVEVERINRETQAEIDAYAK